MRGVVYATKIEDDGEVCCLSWMHCVYVMVHRIRSLHVHRMRMLESQNLVFEQDLDANTFAPIFLLTLGSSLEVPVFEREARVKFSS